jgi:uncharacterized LabA/DUF88 family protein
MTSTRLRACPRNTYEVAMLVSGDGDFAAVADAIGDDLGKHVEAQVSAVPQFRRTLPSSASR